MNGDAIDIFRKNTPAANQMFVRKRLIETSICYSASYSNTLLPHLQEIQTNCEKSK